MFWRILPHASVCVASDELILLDVRQDRYFLIPAGIAAAMRHWLESPGAIIPQEVLKTLVRGGILRPEDSPLASIRDSLARIPQTLLPPAWSDVQAVRVSRTGVAAAVARTWLSLRLRPLQAILAHREVRHARKAGACHDLVERATSFDRARRLAPFARNCLLDSLALDAWLPDGGDRLLVFGVTARPFSAHCWLQAPDVILNDSYDRVSRYAPILAI